MIQQKPRKSSRALALGYGLTFFATLLVARLVFDWTHTGKLFSYQFWATLSAWVVPVGFALISCYAYWYRNRDPK